MAKAPEKLNADERAVEWDLIERGLWFLYGFFTCMGLVLLSVYGFGIPE